MSEDADRLRRGARRGQRLGYAERDPTADVEGLRRRAKGGDPRQHRLQRRGRRRRRHREGIEHDRASPTSSSPAPRLRGEAARRRRASRPRRAIAIAVRVHPAMVPLDHPLAGGPRAVQRGLRRGRRRRRADALRPRRGRRADGERGARRPHRRRAATCGAGGVGRAPPSSTASRSGRSTSCERSTTSTLEVADRPGVLAAVAAVFGAHARLDPLDGAGRPRRRGARSSSSPTSPGGGRAATLAALRDLDAVERIGGLLRVDRTGASMRDAASAGDPTSDAPGRASSSATASSCRSARRRRSSPCSRATRRCSTRRGSPSASAPRST